MVRVLVLTCGYVESARTARLSFLYQGEEPFPTLREALTDLAHGLLEKYKAETSTVRVPHTCCLKADLRYTTFCGTCGSRLKSSFDIEDFAQWISRLHETTADSFGGEEAGLWWPWVSFCECAAYLDELVEINENAEIYLAESLDPVRLTEEERKALADWDHNPTSRDDLERRDGNYTCRYGKDVKRG